MWPFRRVHTAGCTRLTPRCSGGDLRCGCQDPNRLRSAEAAAAEGAEILVGGGGVADDGGKGATGLIRLTLSDLTAWMMLIQTCEL